MPRYNPAEIEPKWQKHWQDQRTFRAPELPDDEKLYVLDMFPYPSGDGLHVGHPEGYTATDIVCRFARMRGTAVLHPMGFDAFGLPAEEHAIKTGTHPRVSNGEKHRAIFASQLKIARFQLRLGRRSRRRPMSPTFKWTQFIFLVLIYDTWFDPEQQVGVARSANLPIPADVASAESEDADPPVTKTNTAWRTRREAPVNWCPALGTVLANEEVDRRTRASGAGIRCVRMPLRQWMLRITAYADRLEKDLDGRRLVGQGSRLLQRELDRPQHGRGGRLLHRRRLRRLWKRGTARPVNRRISPQRPGDDVLRSLHHHGRIRCSARPTW